MQRQQVQPRTVNRDHRISFVQKRLHIIFWKSMNIIKINCLWILFCQKGVKSLVTFTFNYERLSRGLRNTKSLKTAELPQKLLLGHDGSDRKFARSKKTKRKVEAFYTSAPLWHDLHLVSWTSSRWEDWVQTGGGSRRWWVKKRKVCWDSGAGSPSSWPPRVASSCWAAPLAPIRSWSRTRRRRRTPRCLCGLCTSCCRRSSLSGAECSPWLSPVHELQHKHRQKQRDREPRPSNATLYFAGKGAICHSPCCSSRAFCFFRSSMSCWWVWFFRLMYWMYSVALSRICALEACLTEFCQQKFQRAMGQCSRI